MTLHVQSNNECALQFYKKNGFDQKEFLKGYYTDLDPSDCYVLEKLIDIDSKTTEPEEKKQ